MVDSYTKLLLHCDGADASTTFIDSATGKAVTAVGTAQVDTAQSKFGGASLLLDGNSDYLSIPDSDDWNFGTGDFTIDCWFRKAATGAGVNWDFAGVQYVAANNWNRFGYINEGSNLYVDITLAGSSKVSVAATGLTINADTWYHYALVRNGNTFNVHLNGTIVGTTTDADAIPDLASALTIGYNPQSGVYFNGWIDEFRVSKGIARWTANFTPPTKAYGTGGGLGFGNPMIF